MLSAGNILAIVLGGLAVCGVLSVIAYKKLQQRKNALAKF